MLTRRSLLLTASAPLLYPASPLKIDSHIHLFEPAVFPYHPQATYKPEPEPLAPYLAFTKQAGISHAILVHPEPYQDDHRYLAHCLAAQPTFFKGTILLDPLASNTPARMTELTRQHPNKIVALRIHAMNAPSEPTLASGPIKNRDLRDPRISAIFRKAADLGIAIQMHFLPHHAPEIAALAKANPQTTIILDHMGRTGMGTPATLDQVLSLADYPKTIFKYSGWSYFSNPALPVNLVVRRAHQAFGADRIIWGGLGMNLKAHALAQKLFADHWSFAPAADQAKIQGQNAARIFQF